MSSIAAEIVNALGGRNGVCRCPVHNDYRPSLSVTDREDDDIVVTCFAGCDWRDIKDELRHRGLLTDWKPSEFDPERQARIAAERRKRDAEIRENDRRRREWCQSIWNESQEAQNSAVEAYLKGRGIDILPPTIRFHGSLKHADMGCYFPAMIAAITRWPSREVTGVHRTYLQLDGRGKANVSNPKKMAGCCAGGAVRLAAAGVKLGLAEGLESALSVQQATGTPMWACLSTSGLKGVILPETVKEIVLCADGDDPGQAAAEVAAQTFIGEGRTARIASPPTGFDFNDLLRLPGNVALLDTQRGASGHG